MTAEQRWERYAQVGNMLWVCPYTERGWRCGKCMRGVFFPTAPGQSSVCRVCKAEHWIGTIMIMQRGGPRGAFP